MSTPFILENVFGLIGTIFWSFQLAPQDNIGFDVWDIFSSVGFINTINTSTTIISDDNLILGGIQVAGIFGIRESNKHNVKWPEVLVGILSVVLLTSGFMMQFIEIYRIKLVRGVSLIFLTIDMLGSVFSIVSLVFRPPPFDLLASFTYVSVLVCDVVIIILYYLLNWIDSRRCHENSLKEELGDNTVTMSNDRRNLNQKEKKNSEVQE
ncbi:5416_t:CDS:2 [Entrophospora sp. SA101]|nr:5416_t:CDS:2 [Entrophospora sp. SA101]